MSWKTLNERDSRAVDAILMNGRDMNPPAPPIVVATGGVSPEAFRAASKILQLLDSLPSVEPPADLAKRTLLRINAGGSYSSPDADRPGAGGDSNIA